MKKFRKLNVTAIIAFLISATSALIVPWANYDNTLGNRKLAILVAVLFWGGLIMGIVLEVAAAKARKALSEILLEPSKGISAIFRNKEAVVSLIILVIAVACVIIFKYRMLVSATALFAALFSLYFYVLSNGKNYRTFKACRNKDLKKEEIKDEK